jgi:hypothetical protein
MESFTMRKFAALTSSILLAFSCCPSTIAQSAGQENMPAGSSKSVLADGTPVRLRTGRTVSSTDARTGDLVALEVLDEITIDNTVVVPKGGTGLAVVTVAEPKKMMGRGAKLDMGIDSVKLVNGQKAALRAVKQSSGNASQTSIFAAMSATNMSSAALIFAKGKDITIPQGTEFVAYVNGDVPLDLASLQPAAMDAKAAAAAFANSPTEMYFSSFPDSAEIQIDGKFVGTTPTDTVVPPGEHKIDVRLAGFKSWHRTVTADGNRLVFKIRLQQDGQNGSTVSSCSRADCVDIPLGDIAKQKRDVEKSGGPQ